MTKRNTREMAQYRNLRKDDPTMPFHREYMYLLKQITGEDMETIRRQIECQGAYSSGAPVRHLLAVVL